MRNSYTVYRIKSRIRLILMLIGVVALITFVTFLFVYIIQRNQPQKTVLLSSDSSASMASKASSTSSAVSTSGTSSLSTDLTQMKDWRLVLVNPTHKMPSSFQLHIVHVFDKIDMDQRIVQAYNDMSKAARLEKLSLWISVAYRTPKTQNELYNNEITNNIKAGMSSSAATAAAKKAVALPGYSEHHTGLAMDLNGVKPSFDTTKEFAWLQQHAAEYGFVLRYPKNKESITKIMYEPWHYRYVGVDNAKKMKELNMCLEEYIDYLKKNHIDPTE